MLNILQTFYMNAIKYENMIKMTSLAFNGYNDNEINIFIDLYPLMRTLSKPDYLELKSPVDFVSGVLNLAAHYRGFFRRYCQTESTIYIINSMNLSKNNMMQYPEYNKDTLHRYSSRTTQMNNIINTNIDLLNTIIPYIPDVHMVNSSYESSVVMYDIIFKHGGNKPNIIISKDPYVKQLVGLIDKTVIYRPKLNDSYYIDRNNVYQSILLERGVKCNNYNFTNISPKLISLLYTLNGLKCRNIKSPYNIVSSKNIIDRALEDRKLFNDYNSFIDWDSIQTKDSNMLRSIYNVIDIPTQYCIYKNDIESNYKLQNLYDPESVQAINNIYFTNNNQINLNDF